MQPGGCGSPGLAFRRRPGLVVSLDQAVHRKGASAARTTCGRARPLDRLAGHFPLHPHRRIRGLQRSRDRNPAQRTGRSRSGRSPSPAGPGLSTDPRRLVLAGLLCSTWRVTALACGSHDQTRRHIEQSLARFQRAGDQHGFSRAGQLIALPATPPFLVHTANSARTPGRSLLAITYARPIQCPWMRRKVALGRRQLEAAGPAVSPEPRTANERLGGVARCSQAERRRPHAADRRFRGDDAGWLLRWVPRRN